MSEETLKTIATFYKFAEFPEYKDWKHKLGKWGKELNILGTMILAPEGINATISGPREGIEQFMNNIRGDERFSDLTPRLSESPKCTFIVCESSPVRKSLPLEMLQSIQTKRWENMLSQKTGTN